MKKYLFMFIAGIIFLNVWGVPEVSAQGAKAVEAEIKFDFRVGERLFPAGVYRLESVSPGNDNILQLRGVENRRRQLIVADVFYAVRRQSPKLIFSRIGEEYYLTSIFPADGKWGFSLPPSRRRKEREKNLAAAKTVEVPARN